MKSLGRLIGTALWLFYAVHDASGQQLSRVDSCATAVKLVTTGEATDRYAGWALAHVVTCAEGPTAISARWRTANDAPTSLKQLLSWNYQVRDQRIADAAMATARQQGRPAKVRLAALQTLIGYFDPSFTIGWATLQNPPTSGGTVAYVADLDPRVGTQPPAENLPTLVYVVSRQLATDADPVVARAGRYVWQALTDARPGVASLPAGTATLDNLCGTRFRITNRSDIDLSVELVSAKGKPGWQLRIPAHSSREVNAVDTGTVRLVLLGGQELASGRTGDGRCP